MFVIASNVLPVENKRKFSKANAEKEVNAPKKPTKINSLVDWLILYFVERASNMPATREPHILTAKVLHGKLLIVSRGISKLVQYRVIEPIMPPSAMLDRYSSCFIFFLLIFNDLSKGIQCLDHFFVAHMVANNAMYATFFC